MINYLSRMNKRRLLGTALLRLDFNTEDDWRMRAIIPTIKFLLKTSEKIVIVSHRGRPAGFDKKLSLAKDAKALSRLLGKKISFIGHFRFAGIKKEIAAAPRGSVFLLENLRFMPGEEANDPRFAKELASLADFYVNDAFAVSHRANASVVAITKCLPSYAGLEFENELRSLGNVIARPGRPLTLVLGGAKAADKLGVIRYFRKKADAILVGGGSANTLLVLRGVDVKRSMRETDPSVLKKLREVLGYKNIVLPEDFIWEGGKILDIGPKTAKMFAGAIRGARTIVWSGPLGLIEKKKDAEGSVAVARAIAGNKKAFSIAGGGETVMFLKKYGLDKKFSFISTGGGAMVDFLAGEKLPGVEALKRSLKR